MTISKDGVETSQDTACRSNVPDYVKVASDLAKLRDYLSRLAFDSKNCLETNCWTTNPPGKVVAPFLRKNKWPEMYRSITQICDMLEDSTHFEEIMEELLDRYFDISADGLRQQIDEITGLVRKANVALGDIDPALISKLDSSDDQYLQWSPRIYDFATEYLEKFNSLARFIQEGKPSVFPWLTPTRATIEVHSPYL